MDLGVYSTRFVTDLLEDAITGRNLLHVVTVQQE
jgi:hypothetical protein